MSADPFQAEEHGWTRVNRLLATGRRAIAAVSVSVAMLVGVVALIAMDYAVWVPAVIAAGVSLLGWLWWVIGRQVRAIGYADRKDDLLVVSGILFKRLVVVPYGRMQQVDVRRGPIERYLGLATVQLHTAAATTDATIPGLDPDEAGRLRDQLASLGEQRSAGL